MAPLLLMVFHLFMTTLMMHISLLVLLDIQSSTIIRKINPTSGDRYPPNYQTYLQYLITSMIKLNGTSNKICNISYLYHLLHCQYCYIIKNNIKLLFHKNYHIIHTTKIILVMINMILQYYNIGRMIHKILNILRGIKRIKILTILYHSEGLTLFYTKFILSKLLLLVYIYLFLKERRIFTLIIHVLYYYYYY